MACCDCLSAFLALSSDCWVLKKFRKSFFLILLSNILALLGATFMQFDFALAASCAIYARDGDDRVQQTPRLEAQVVLVAVKQEIAMRELCEGERDSRSGGQNCRG